MAAVYRYAPSPHAFLPSGVPVTFVLHGYALLHVCKVPLASAYCLRYAMQVRRQCCLQPALLLQTAKHGP